MIISSVDRGLSESRVSLTNVVNAASNESTSDVSRRLCNASKRALVHTISISASTGMATAYAMGGVALIGACSTIPAAAIYTSVVVGLVFFASPPGWFAAGGIFGVFVTTAFLYLAYKLCITVLQSCLKSTSKIVAGAETHQKVYEILENNRKKPIKSTICKLLISPIMDVTYPIRLFLKMPQTFFKPGAFSTFNFKESAFNASLGLAYTDILKPTPREKQNLVYEESVRGSEITLRNSSYSPYDRSSSEFSDDAGKANVYRVSSQVDLSDDEYSEFDYQNNT